MKRRIFRAHLMLALAFIPSGSVVAQDTAVVVQARLSSGEPAPIGSSVAIRFPTGVITTAGTDALGNAELVIPRGQPTIGSLEIRSSGFVTINVPWAGQARVDLLLVRAAAVQGRVESESGVPLMAVVNVEDSSRSLQSVETKSDGSFEVNGLNGGAALMLVRARGMSPTLSSIRLIAGEVLKEVVVRAVPPITARGMVLSELGSPAVGVLVTPRLRGSRRSEILSNFLGGSLKTDANGEFEIQGIPPETVLEIRVAGKASVPAREFQVPASGTWFDLGAIVIR